MKTLDPKQEIGVKEMMKINLLDNLIADPLVSKPDKQKSTSYWEEYLAKSTIVDPYVEDKKLKATKRKITMCGCEKHPVNPKKDVYMQHNHWLAQQHPKVEYDIERWSSDLYSVKAIGASIEKPQLTYDFSGEEFEVTTEQMRIVNDREKKETN